MCAHLVGNIIGLDYNITPRHNGWTNGGRNVLLEAEAFYNIHGSNHLPQRKFKRL